MRRRARVVTCASVVTLLVAASGSLAGPLDPPPGPVAPTRGPEPRVAVNTANTPGDADSLYKITQPGSYYLTGNITGVIGKHGIEIASSGVTLDLNGFDLAGVAGMGAFDGVSVTVDTLRSIAATNGTVRNWGDAGIDLGPVSFGCRVENVLASGNAGHGINAAVSGTVLSCTASFNTLSGIRTNNGCTISNCSAYSNTANGIQVNNGCTISNCSAYQNSNGILTGVGCTVIDASVFTNVNNGVQLGEGGTVTRCSAVSNSKGINAANGCTVTECAASFNATDGIRVAEGARISACTTCSNQSIGLVCGNNGIILDCISTSNGTGILTAFAVVIINCNVSVNNSDGIGVFAGCTVTGCTVNGNGLVGIRGGASDIRDNHCEFNDAANILMNGEGARIEGNHCTGADKGIEVTGPGNFIIRNTCSNNAIDWVIAANNAVGPILDRRTATLPAINGFSSPTSLNTTDPHANFSY